MQVPDHAARISVEQAAGVRLAFRTSARRLRLRVSATRVAHTQQAVLEPAWWDVTCRDAIVASTPGWIASRYVRDASGGPMDYLAAPDEHLQFDIEGGGANEREYEIWLPHTDDIELIGLFADAQIDPPDAASRPQWVHHGGIVSHGYGATRTLRSWPALAAHRLRFALTNLSFAGSALVDQFTARTIRDSAADLISLDLGSDAALSDHMGRRVFVSAVHGFLDTIRDTHADTPIIVLSPLTPSCTTGLAPHANTPQRCAGKEGRSIARPRIDPLTAAAAGRALFDIVEDRRYDDPRLAYLDGSGLREWAGEQRDCSGACPPVTDATHAAIADRFAGDATLLMRRAGPEPPHELAIASLQTHRPRTTTKDSPR
jgi:hypothetical protein